MKSILKFLLCVSIVTMLFLFDGCEEKTSIDETSLPDLKAEIVETKTFIRTEDNFYREVSADCQTIDFSEEFTLSEDAKWYLCKDKYGAEQILTKVATVETGDNFFYAVVLSGDEKKIKVYPVTVHKKGMYVITYRSEGEVVASYLIEEGSLPTVPTAPKKKGYIFEKWNTDLLKTVTEKQSIEAVFQKCTNHTPDENTCVCTKCGETDMTAVQKVIKEKKFFREGNKIYLGSYPQQKVTEEELSSALTKIAGQLPKMGSMGSVGQWTSYGFLSNGNTQDYMWYTDVEWNEKSYRGVYFTKYRPSWGLDSAIADNSYVDDNGYKSSKVYWFEYAPICWQILKEDGKKVLLFCDLILDSREFDYGNDFGNSYENSTLRKWLCEIFLNTALKEEQNMLVETLVENGEKSTNPSGRENEWNKGKNSYAGEDTIDKVWIPSVEEVTNEEYGFSNNTSESDELRRKEYTDYALCMGLRCIDETEESANWWLRSPSFTSEFLVDYVRYDGRQYANYVRYSCFGVVPEIWVILP